MTFKASLRPWLASYIIGFFLAFVFAVLPFITGSKGDSHIGNWIVYFIVIFMHPTFLVSLVIAFLTERFSKNDSNKVSFLSITVSMVTSFAILTFASKPFLGVWFWKVSRAFFIYWIYFCIVPSLPLFFIKKQKEHEAAVKPKP